MVLLNFTLVNRGEWLLSPANFKGAKKKKKKKKKDANFYFVRNKTKSYLMEGNAYETRQSSLLYVFIRCFGLDRA